MVRTEHGHDRTDSTWFISVARALGSHSPESPVQVNVVDDVLLLAPAVGLGEYHIAEVILISFKKPF